MRILMVTTSHDRLGETGRKTGFWLEEFAAPYYTFIDAGAEVTIASPRGGLPPIDPGSERSESRTEATERLRNDPTAWGALANTARLTDVREEDYDAVYYPGGHGVLWDLHEDADSIGLIEAFYAAGKPVAAVCHAPAALLRATFDGRPLVAGRRVSGFTNSEEEAVGLTGVVPFLVEDELKRLGGVYERTADWRSIAVVDGHLVTGQNPASSRATAREVLRLLGCETTEAGQEGECAAAPARVEERKAA
ncbi:MAG: type 1 glutamine amidotransferase domain-containing protein [Syntrophobacteraceae bacterium]